MKFIADAMLGRLAKRLRLMGHDVLYDPSWDDNEIIRRALEQDRVILTRDTGLAARPLAANHLLIDRDHPDEQLDQVRAMFPFAREQPLSRCSVCNGTLSSVGRSEVQDRVPDHIALSVRTFFVCSGCGRVYWEGSHVRNIRDRKKNKPAP